MTERAAAFSGSPECVDKPIFGGFAKTKASLVEREVARSAGGIVLNKGKIFKMLSILNFHYNKPSVTA